MELTKEQIKENHDAFVELVRSISDREFDVEKVITKLENSDFFIAPATTQYHHSYAGGLCQHSLQVYENLKFLVESFSRNLIKEDSIKVVALFHDLCRLNFFDTYVKNVNVNGNWEQQEFYKTRDDHFVLGSSEQNSLFLLQKFMSVSVEEACAILHSAGGQAWDSAKDNIPEAYGKYPLAMYLHMADLISSYD